MSKTLSSCIAFLLLSKFNNAQSDMLHRIAVLKDAQKVCPADFMTVVTLFKTMEIIPSSFPMRDAIIARLHQCCDEAAVVADTMPTPHMVPGDENPPQTGSDMVLDVDMKNKPIGDANAPQKDDCIISFKNRIIEHNIRVLSRYYTEIRTTRAAEMLGLSTDDLETHLAEMAQPPVFDGQSSGQKTVTTEDEEAGFGGTALYIRINRPDGIVSFTPPTCAESTLSDWSSDITGLFTLMETTCHLINRENMVYKA